jgi:tetratricopeptide (TPR) repeat protein
LKLDEYLYYVDYAAKNYIPKNLMDNYFEWQHRSNLARFLFRDGQLAPAIELFKSIVDIEVDETNEDNNCPSDLEVKVWCLKELGIAVWLYMENAQEALKYLDMAIELMNAYFYKFHFICRGEVWRDRWDILKGSGSSGFAEQEAAAKIFGTIPEAGKSNSLLFYGFSFLAEVAKQSNDVRKANRLLRTALRYFPGDYDDIKQLNTIWREGHCDPEGAYYKLLELTHHDYLLWDDAGEEMPIILDEGAEEKEGLV